MQDASRPLKARSLFNLSETSGGALSDTNIAGLLSGGLVRPPKLRDLLTVIPVVSDQVEYVKESSRTAAAAAVAEATATTGATGLKPEAALCSPRWLRQSAQSLCGCRRPLGLSQMHRSFAATSTSISGPTFRLSSRISSSPVTAWVRTFTGLLTVAGTQTLAAPVGPASNLDNIRKALTLVRVNARSEPTAVVLNPTDAQNIDLLKENNEANNFVGPGPYGIGAARLWNVPVIETDALAAGTALVGDFSKAVLFDRKSLSITLGTINDQFVRNMITILGEVRAGFGVIRPTTFCKCTLA